MKKAKKVESDCKHPPHRLYSGFTFDPWRNKKVMWVACCECGEVIKPGVVEPEGWETVNV